MKSTRAKAVLTRARKRYADGGALGKADLGDFRQNDPIREMYRAVMDQYFPGDARADPRSANVTTATRTPAPPPEGDLPPIWRTTMQGGATARATPSNAAAKGDLGAPATDTQPGIWEGVRASVRPPAAIEDPDWAGMNPVDRHRLLTEIRNNQKVSPEQMAANGRQNIEDLLSITPVIGNIMAAENAARSGTNAALDIGEGKYKSAAINSALALLSGFGAVTGLPTGKAAGAVAKDAGRTAAVFVPAGESKAAELARKLRNQGETNDSVFRKSGLFFGPEGQLRREITDFPMEANTAGMKIGETVPLGSILKHDALFKEFPELRDHPVVLRGRTQHTDGPMSHTDPKTGKFMLELGPDDANARRDLAKMLQYKIADMHGFPRSMRHGFQQQQDDMNTAIGQAALSGSPHAQAYAHSVMQTKDFALEAAKNKNERTATSMLTNRSAGNVDSRHVRGRVDVPDVSDKFPYARRPSYLNASPKQAPGAFEHLMPLPAMHATNDDIKTMLENWIKYGSGKPRFANGGKVAGTLQRARQQLASGGLIGHTPGRSDKLPVKAAEGSYVIPADVVAALGEGNSMAGHKVLFGRFPGALGKGVKKPAKPHLATGGRTPGVYIIVSDGEFIVTPEDVAALGGGDIGYGHDVLDAFVTNTRKQNIQTLSTLPGPKT